MAWCGKNLGKPGKESLDFLQALDAHFNLNS